MGEREPPDFDLFDERFQTLQLVQQELERRGYFFSPIPKEHTEGLVTGPLLHRLRTAVKKRGFGNVAGRVALTFSGYAHDPREVYEIPEARAYWQELDAQLPEFPALLAALPAFGYNGPGMALTMVGEIDARIHRPGRGGYDVHVVGAERLIAEAVRRIRAAGQRYRLRETAVANLVDQFRRAATYRLP
jgi:hypothetical protein